MSTITPLTTGSGRLMHTQRHQLEFIATLLFMVATYAVAFHPANTGDHINRKASVVPHPPIIIDPEAMLRTQHERLTHLRSVCSSLAAELRLNSVNGTASKGKSERADVANEYNDGSKRADLEHLLVDDQTKIIYCYVPKVACTNWKRVLLALRDPQATNPRSIDPAWSHREHWQTLSSFDDPRLSDINYTRFLFVRHPFERLLSAYRNKFELAYGDYFRKRYGRAMRSRYEGLDEADPSNDGVASFFQFLRFVAEGAEWNEHWRAVFDICHPCHIKYDYIGMYETLQADSVFILDQIAKSRNITKTWSFPTREETYDRKPTRELMKEYYSSIPPSLKDELFNVFSNDIRLFSYDNKQP